MPDRNRHIAQADTNERLYAHLVNLDPLYRDWQCTVLFYAALHHVDAFLATVPLRPDGVHPTSHQQRQTVVYLLLRPINEDYRRLEAASREARYDTRLPRDYDRLYANEFTRIRTFVRNALNLPL